MNVVSSFDLWKMAWRCLCSRVSGREYDLDQGGSERLRRLAYGDARLQSVRQADTLVARKLIGDAK